MARNQVSNGVLGRRMKAAMLRAGLTSREVGRRLGVHENTVGKWLRGVTEPSSSALAEFARQTGTTSEELLGLHRPGQAEAFVEIADSIVAGADAAQAIERAGGVLEPEQRREYAAATEQFRGLFLQMAWEVMTDAERHGLYERVLEYAFRQDRGDET